MPSGPRHGTASIHPKRPNDEHRSAALVAQRTGTIFAVLFLDVDDFKAINDARGHEFGDLVLETLGRPEDAGLVADKILRSLQKRFTLGHHRVKTSVSIGISVHPDNDSDAEVLLRAADYAMYLAKDQGKNRWLSCPKGLPGPGKSVGAVEDRRRVPGH